MTTRHLSLSIALTVAAGSIASTADAALYWTPWVSEESGGPATICTSWSDAAVGFGCSGNYCDNVRLLCETLPFGATLDPATDYWTGYFSEEHDEYMSHTSVGWYPWFDENFQVCHPAMNAPGIVSGVKCQGNNCDNISIECTQPVKWINGVRTPVYVTNCEWKGWYSEEHGSVDFGWNRYITGIECQGSNCDEKKYHICSLVNPVP